MIIWIQLFKELTRTFLAFALALICDSPQYSPAS
jgi:hypothetical protein